MLPTFYQQMDINMSLKNRRLGVAKGSISVRKKSKILNKSYQYSVIMNLKISANLECVTYQVDYSYYKVPQYAVNFFNSNGVITYYGLN